PGARRAQGARRLPQLRVIQMSKRLAMLEKLAASEPVDSFTLYALALEYRNGGRASDAIATFQRLRDRDPEYVPMYLMARQLLSDEGRGDDAREWILYGLGVATRKGDGKARSELAAALEEL